VGQALQGCHCFGQNLIKGLFLHHDGMVGAENAGIPRGQSKKKKTSRPPKTFCVNKERPCAGKGGGGGGGGGGSIRRPERRSLLGTNGAETTPAD